MEKRERDSKDGPPASHRTAEQEKTHTRQMDGVGTTTLTTRTGVQVTITISQTTSGNGSLWTGLFHFAVDSDCSIDYLRGAKGGYVSAVSRAVTTSDFIERVFRALCERQLTPIDFSGITRFTPCDPMQNPSLEWAELSKKALLGGEVEFTEFHLYNEGSSYVEE